MQARLSATEDDDALDALVAERRAIKARIEGFVIVPDSFDYAPPGQTVAQMWSDGDDTVRRGMARAVKESWGMAIGTAGSNVPGGRERDRRPWQRVIELAAVPRLPGAKSPRPGHWESMRAQTQVSFDVVSDVLSPDELEARIGMPPSSVMRKASKHVDPPRPVANAWGCREWPGSRRPAVAAPGGAA